VSGPPYRIVRLDRKLDRSGFACGTAELDSYFHRQVGQEVDRGFAACFTAFDNVGTLVGYYVLSALSVSVDLVPEQLRKKLPRYDQIPCALLGRLAVSQYLQKQGVGRLMLLHALRTAEASDVASYALIADAKDEGARDYCEKFGFTRWDPERPMRCFMPLRGGAVPPAKAAPPKGAAAAQTAPPLKASPPEPPVPDVEPEPEFSSPRPALKRIR
jgi:predicted N-acetyltransferase YhbS